MAILLFYIFGTGCHTSATRQHCSASQLRSSVLIIVIFIKDRFLAEFVELDTPKTFLTPELRGCVIFTVAGIESDKESKKCLLEQHLSLEKVTVASCSVTHRTPAHHPISHSS
ncbi:hypothetical protein T01_11622 [Trichinella spiralis]|uniref:Uncharacterized protein n=1 Tax=Trichinella spiralis TaxID=6334 RepID=A0A0V1AU78_TRISP|nr:hypothetical protein T01_11622 [Trichinella spiralis]